MIRLTITLFMLMVVSIGTAIGVSAPRDVVVSSAPAAVRAALLEMNSDNVRVTSGQQGRADIRPQHSGDQLRWFVMAGDQIASIWEAQLVAEGDGTRVKLNALPGTAPPAGLAADFADPGASKALLRTLITSELSKLTALPKATADTCFQMLIKMRDEAVARENPIGAEDEGWEGRRITRSRPLKALARAREMGCNRMPEAEKAKLRDMARAADANDLYNRYGPDSADD